jgi:pimeloyl-ACP methyl ester carboxylesterase
MVFILAGVALVTALGLWRMAMKRRGRRVLRVDVPPGVVDDGFVRLGDVEQWVSIRGERADNPILLVLHGGPGASYTVFTPEIRPWERCFTVVQWDRRGVGKTLGRNGVEGCGDLTFARMQDDCVELCGVLAQRLPGRPVVLLASSAGTMVGLPLVHRRPDLFAGYVGTDFNAGLAANEVVAGPATLAWTRANARSGEVRFLEQLGTNPGHWSARTFDRLMRLRDRTAGPGKGIGAIFGPRMLRSPLHSVRDLWHLVHGLSLSTRALFPQMVAFDAYRAAPRVDVPFFLFQGELDVFTPPSVARAFYEQLAAPSKHFEVLPGVGHMGAFVQPLPFLERLETVSAQVQGSREVRAPLSPQTASG